MSMKCDENFHKVLEEYIICSFCDVEINEYKQPQNKCCESQTLINDNGAITCIRCRSNTVL